jgi:hypothetical protein
MKTPGIEPMTLGLVVQCLNQLRHSVPPLVSGHIHVLSVLSLGRNPRYTLETELDGWADVTSVLKHQEIITDETIKIK